MTDIKVIKAEDCHAERIHELLGYIARVHRDGRPDIFKGDEPKYDPAQVRGLLASPDDYVHVAVAPDGYVVGYMICQLVDRVGHPHLKNRRTLYIDDLCVDESYHGKGIGTLLFEDAEALGKQLGCDIIDLNVWSFNAPAIKFYEGLGLKESRRHMEMKIN